ncbi:hypothetical protein [Mycobacterium sp.]|uniref:hypothetical protein n=1 Tax=Mycobacterium sp. TaxID=1785 RepID=UPI003A8B6175
MLARFANRIPDDRVAALAERTGAPVTVTVSGRRGAGRHTVAGALDRVGRSSGIRAAVAAGEPDLRVHVLVETVKPEDHRGEKPVLAVLNKTDTIHLRGAGPMPAAQARCVRLSALMEVPTLPLSGLLAVAGCRGLDGACWAGLRALAADPGMPGLLDGSFDGVLAASLPVPVAVRQRLLATLDLLGIALGSAALRQGADMAQVRALWRQVSGVDAVVEQLVAAGTVVRYRRVCEAVAVLEALAVSNPQIRTFLSRDDTVLARTAAAVDVVAAAGLEPGPDEPLARAVHWQRCRAACASELHRACAADIARGSLRLWSRAGGVPSRGVPRRVPR